MGWDGTRPTHYKNGKVDRKAECDERFTWSSDTQEVSVLKSIIKGTTYYGAIKVHKLDTQEDCVVGVVALTRMDRDGWFMVKTMEETVGPLMNKKEIDPSVVYVLHV